MATVISDLRLITLLPTEGQTIYVYNLDNPNEYYTESFFAKIGTTWGFCVVPDRRDNKHDYFVNIVQTNNQTIILNAIIPEAALNSESRAGILNYYSTNLADKYTYTIGYQNIRVFVTAILKSIVTVEYKFIDVEQSPNQLILLIDESNNVYSYGVSLPINSKWKAVLIVDPNYKPGVLTITHGDDGHLEAIPEGEIATGFVNEDLIISATPAQEIYTKTILKPYLFDNSTTNYSNSDDYIEISIGTDTNKYITQTILLYAKNKVNESNSVRLGTNSNKLYYAELGAKTHKKASKLVYNQNSKNKYILRALEGYYGYDYILGYSVAINKSSLTPNSFVSDTTRIIIKGIGFWAEDAPVDTSTEGMWFFIIDPPSSEYWNYIKFMMFDDNGRKIFSIFAQKNDFEEITSGKYIGQLLFTLPSSNGISDDAYIFLRNKFDNNDKINAGVSIL